jgi:hypothetical protein
MRERSDKRAECEDLVRRIVDQNGDRAALADDLKAFIGSLSGEDEDIYYLKDIYQAQSMEIALTEDREDVEREEEEERGGKREERRVQGQAALVQAETKATEATEAK